MRKHVEPGRVCRGEATSGEYMIVGTAGGSQDAQHGEAGQDIFFPENQQMIGGVPWRPSDDDPQVGGEPGKTMVCDEVRMKAEVEEEVRLVMQQRMHIRSGGLEQFGYFARPAVAQARPRRRVAGVHTAAQTTW